MATEIKRVRFFDGQFLKQVDFNDEQRYHQHLRRRMNFLLFGSDGVVSVKLPATDLLLEVVGATKSFRVLAGMAIGRNLVESEGREVILLEDSAPIDLVAAGFGPGGTATVTIHFEEQATKDPPSEGDVDEDTRFKERAVIAVHAGVPPLTTAAGDPFIVLGKIAFDTMTIDPDPASRQVAKLRASLIGGAPPPPAPVVLSVGGGTTVTAGGPSVAMIINGNNLTGGTVAFPSDPAVTGVVVSSSVLAITVNVTATAAATPGPKGFVVTTLGGSTPSPGGAVLTVNPAAALPSIASIDVHSAVQGTTVPATISGLNLGGATGVTFTGGVTAAIQLGGTSATVPVQITVPLAAAIGGRTFKVSVSGFPDADSALAGAPAAFAVNAALPAVALLSLQPNLQLSGATIDVHGMNIRNPALAPGAVAAGTAVALRKAAVTKAALNPTVRPDVAGHQVVRITIPNRTGTPWAKTEPVTLDLTFTGASGTGSLTFTYDDP